MNKKGYTNLKEVLRNSLKPLSAEKVKELNSQGVVVIDCRDQNNVKEIGIVSGSIAINLGLPFEVLTGILLNPNHKIVILCDPRKEEEAVIRMSRVGFDNCLRYLEGRIEEWISKGNPVVKN